MPKVGKKEFSYSEKGKAEAKAYAEKTGQKVEKGSSPMAYESNDARNRSKMYKEGGKVDDIRNVKFHELRKAIEDMPKGLIGAKELKAAVKEDKKTKKGSRAGKGIKVGEQTKSRRTRADRYRPGVEPSWKEVYRNKDSRNIPKKKKK